jgi:multiple sugar transport system permease protein
MTASNEPVNDLPALSGRPTSRRTAPRRWRLSPLQAVLGALIIVIGLLMLSPIIWVAVTSVEVNADQFRLPPRWIPTHTTAYSFKYLFSHLPFLAQLLNTVGITIAVVVFSTLVSILAAYAFARLSFPGRDLLFGIFLVSLMVPVQVAAVPQFLIVKHLGLMNSRLSLIVPALIQVFGIFILREQIRTVPLELDDAAKLDGASSFMILRKIIVPMSWPSISAVAVITAQYIWNDFFWPNLFISDPKKMTASLGLVTMQSTFRLAPVGAIFAGISILVIPITLAFIFLQRRLTRSLSYAGVMR